MARVYYSNSSVGNSTNSTTTYTDKVSVTFTPTSGKRYAIFWTAAMLRNNTNADGQVRLQDTTNTVTYQQFNIEAQDTTDEIVMTDVALFTAPNGNSITFAVQFASESGTTTIRDTYISVLELFDDEQATTTEAEITTTDPTYTTTDSITVGAGDWFIIASAGMNTPSTTQITNSIGIRIFDGTNSYMERFAFFSNDSTNWTPYWGSVDVPATSGATYELQFEELSTLTFALRYRTILAVRKGNFAQTFSATDETASTTTSNAFQNKLTLSATPTYAVDHLILATWVTDINATNSSVVSQFYKGGVAQYSNNIFREGSDVDDRFQQGWADTETLTTSTVAWEIDYRSETNGVTSTITNASIIILNLGTDVVPPTAVGYSFGFILL